MLFEAFARIGSSLKLGKYAEFLMDSGQRSRDWAALFGSLRPAGVIFCTTAVGQTLAVTLAWGLWFLETAKATKFGRTARPPRSSKAKDPGATGTYDMRKGPGPEGLSFDSLFSVA